MLRSGKYIPLEGVYASLTRTLNVMFSYNRTFNRAGEDQEQNYPRSGSWTKQMRPDYTLSLWPVGFTEEEAEVQELVVHVHFDAKYKVEDLGRIFGDGNSELDNEKEEQRQGIYKRADLLKMHAYRDAIRRTAGAYVLYPGTESQKWRGFHEILPGLGAFALRPSAGGDDGSQELREFIKSIAEHVCDRASARERESYHTFEIHERPAEFQVHQSMPEKFLDESSRQPPLAEIFVLVGWCRGEEHHKWIVKERLYNCRMDTAAGSLRLKPEITGARYLMLHGDGGKARPGLFRISSKGPRVISKEALKKKGYPLELNHDNYLIFDIEPAKEFDGFEWDYGKLESRQENRKSAWPYSVTLAELLAARLK